MVFFFADEPSTGDLARLRSATRGHLGPHHVTQPTFETGPRGALNILTAIAAAVINSSTATHSAIVTVIVTVAVLTAALAWSERVRRQVTAKDLEDRLSR